MRHTLIRFTAVARSAGVKNQALVGESGKKTLKMHMTKAGLTRNISEPECDGSQQGQDTGYDHKPSGSN